MHDIALAFLWHHHQPYYPDLVSGHNPMPWVRLHGTKDYWGMAMLLKEAPAIRATINLVPSLLVQLLAYTEQGHEDEHLRVSRLPADGLSHDDMLYLLDNFFMVHPDHMIRPYPRYHELHQKRGLGIDPASRAARRFSKRDILDLQVWSNLTWFHPLAFEVDQNLADFRAQGGNWSPDEKEWLLKQQSELLAEVIPLHRELAARGQIELTTTPFYHPILPLLWDKNLAREAMKDVRLPRHLESHAEDASEQIRRAVTFHERVFGVRPRGLWPSEGSVCQAMIPAVAAAGFDWMATDEEILSRSTDGRVSRDEHGHLRNPEMLYRPWRVEEGGHRVQVVFRDHAMSDQIGFQYQRNTAGQAVADFLGKVEAIGRATRGAADRPALVSIVLDGDNCWEYYPNGGVDFVRSLYRGIADHPRIKPVKIGEHLARHPATQSLRHLFAGSWISHNFGIWIGHPECNQAWDLVSQTRAHLVSATRAHAKPAVALERAWNELYIAQGSDWFWWFGDSHTSSQDALFDWLFRKHLENVYLLLGDDVPGELARPIGKAQDQPQPHAGPTGLLNVKLDGRRTYFEWINAGHYVAGTARTAMSQAREGRISEIYFGFDGERLLVRLDCRGGSVRERLADVDTLRLGFLKPDGCELLISHLDWRQPIVQFYRHDVPVAESGVAAAAGAILEVAVPLSALGAVVNDPIHMVCELLVGERSIERAPQEGAIETSVPSPDFELIYWQA